MMRNHLNYIVVKNAGKGKRVLCHTTEKSALLYLSECADISSSLF